MRADPEYVREYYSSLSNEELLAVDRADLVDMAQQCYDAEVSKRGLTRRSNRRTEDARGMTAPLPYAPDETAGDGEAAPGSDAPPAWLSNAAEAYSIVERRGAELRLADACAILATARIPCYSELVELSLSERSPEVATHRWRIMVPVSLAWRAMSTLDRDIANPDFEAAWRDHLESLRSEDLVAMDPKSVLCSLYDRIERATRVYEEELARRGLQAKTR
jgi:hypothetical protein